MCWRKRYTCFACESRWLWFFCQPVHCACVKMTSRVGKHERLRNMKPGYMEKYNFATTKLVLLPGLEPGSKSLLPPKNMNF